MRCVGEAGAGNLAIEEREEDQKEGDGSFTTGGRQEIILDDISRNLKANRLAATNKATQPSLGPKFTKAVQALEAPRVEKDERGREMMITMDENGKVKRKVKQAKVENESSMSGLLMPNKDSKTLGVGSDPNRGIIAGRRWAWRYF